ncbi:MAG TPA: 2-phospho-L-lactate guanylyltransferase [Candidatus Dormibacteraeota bacterium]|jgi:2-phospho-L-lactate guanylyltransferase|nr:2-phospho-L-lactate guanylyltransferase [Candidatus Dormibacteraeota bacterium]
MSDSNATWLVVLIKDFAAAKQRLRPALDPGARRELARGNARRALGAARANGHVLAVCGSEAAADLAREEGADILLEEEPRGQNAAAMLGISHALAQGATSLLLLSSDLPLVSSSELGDMLEVGVQMGSPAVLAAPATGRGGTNALYLAPPDIIDLHFGDDSLRKFERTARARGVAFALHESPALALDLDEPSDLAMLARQK